jgi:hypothetical protein
LSVSFGAGSLRRQGAVIVAVTSVNKVQAAADDVVVVVAVGQALVRAVARFVFAAAIRGGALRRVARAHGDDAFVVMLAVITVQVAVVQVVRVIAVLDAGVTTILAVAMLVILVRLTTHNSPIS